MQHSATPPGEQASIDSKRRRLKALLRPDARPPRRDDGPVPLTPEQRGLLFLHRLDPEASLYNVPVALDLHGPLDEAAMARAFADLVRRHPLLGSRLSRHDGAPVLVARADGGPELRTRDVAGTSEDEYAEVRSEAERPLELEEEGVARALLLRCGPDRHRLLIVVHHMVFDGDSAVIVLEDLRALYGARFGQPGPGEPSADFTAYAEARADEVTRRGTELREFWRDRVEGINGQIALPFDHEAVVPRTRAAESLPVVLGPDRSAAVHGFAAARRTSVFAVLLSAYLLTLARYEPERRSAVAVPVGTRQDSRFDRTVGYFINMLPIREPARRDVPAARYVAWVQSELSSALDHAALPFPRIVELMRDVDPESGNPFTCPFAFQSWYGEPPTDWAGGLAARIVESVHQKGMGHGNLTLSELHGEISGFLKYDVERFTRATAESIAADLIGVIDRLVADPDRPAAEVVGAPKPRTPREAVRPTSTPTPVEPASPAPVDPSEARDAVRAAWTDLLGNEPASEDAQFFSSGGDSILAVQLVSRLRRDGYTLAVRHVYRHPVLRDLAGFLADSTDRPAAVPVRPAPAVPVPAAAPVPPAALAPAQAWFFDRVSTDRQHWNQSVALDLNGPVSPEHLRFAVQAVITAHPTLSARFARTGDGWRMIEQEPFTGCRPRDVLETADVADPCERDTAIAKIQGSLDPFTGRNLRALHVHAPDGEQLVLMAHHLVVDGLSWRILLDDLDQALRSLADGEFPRLEPESQPITGWLTRVAEQVAEPRGREHWREVARARASCGTLLRATPPGCEGDAQRIDFTLDTASTDLILRRVPTERAMPVHDVLTGAVALALARWRGCRPVTLDVETHGRPEDDQAVDLTRTVGWCTAVDPVVLDADRTLPPARYLDDVRGVLAARRDVPGGFLAHRYLGDDEELAAMRPALASFNYLGQVDRLGTGGRFTLAPEPVPFERSHSAERLYPVEVYALVRGGELQVGVSWSPSPEDGVDEHSVRALDAQLRTVLTELVRHEAADADRWPLTPQQRGLVVDAMLNPDRYVEQFHWGWQGAFDSGRFTRAWESLYRRHAVLRGRAEATADPSFVVAADAAPAISWHSTDQDWEGLIRAERERGVDVTRPPLLRIAVHGDGDAHRILMTFHHALLDGWSVALLLGRFYEAYLAGTDPSTVAEERPDARDHARWIADVDDAAARDYWSGLLRHGTLVTRPGLPAPSLPRDGGTGRRAGEVENASIDRVRAWAAELAATESSVLQALWAALLWRCAGTEDPATVAFGVTMSGRGVPVPGVEEMPGLFMNSLPLAIEVRPDEPFGALVERVRDAALELSAFEWASTGRIHEWSGLPGGSPLFESLLVVENYPSSMGDIGERLADAGVHVEVPRSVGGDTPYPLTLLAHHGEDGLCTTLVYDESRVTGEDADGALGFLRTGLRGLAEPDAARRTVAELVGGYRDDDLPRIHDRAARETADHLTWPDGPERDIVTAAFRAVLDLDSVAPGDHFFDLGGHSLQAMGLLRELAERGAGDLRLDHLVTHPTASELAWFLHRGPIDQTGPLVPLRPGDGPAVYLVHPPGGQVACYAEMAAHYPAAADLVGVRDLRADRPGSQPYRSVEELADGYLAALPPGSGPLVLGGFSGGGVIAYELARRLDAEGRPPALVVIIDCAAPTGEAAATGAERGFLAQLEEFDGDRPAADAGGEYLHELAAIAEWTRGHGTGDPFALLRDTLTAIERYRPEPYAGPVVVLRAGDTDLGKGADFDVSADYYAREGLGWEDHCERLSVITVPGNHVTLLTGPNIGPLAATIADLVAEHVTTPS